MRMLWWKDKQKRWTRVAKNIVHIKTVDADWLREETKKTKGNEVL